MEKNATTPVALGDIAPALAEALELVNRDNSGRQGRPNMGGY